MKSNYPWQKAYEAAIVETQIARMQTLVREAKGAIDARLHELLTDHGGTPQERLAISDALASLNFLRREIKSRLNSKPEGWSGIKS